MSIIRVGVLRGGPSQEHSVSAETGKIVLKNLPRDKYIAKDIFLTKKGDWIFDRQFSHPEKIFRSVDVVFNALHGYYGEDGKIQQLLETHGMPYTGSGILASSIGMNKALARDVFSKADLNVAKAVILTRNNLKHLGTESPSEMFTKTAEIIFKMINPPWVVKPNCSGSSVGVSIARHFGDLASAIETAFKFDDKVIVEEFIAGKETSCGVIDNFRNSAHYALPVVEIIPPAKTSFFDAESKYNGESREECPARLPLDMKKEIERMAIIAHKAIGCRHYSRSDFIISNRPGRDKNKIYILEINTLPGLTEQSLLPKALKAVGSSYGEFLDHLVMLALKK